MLESLPFEGTIKVRNKGVDVVILADRSNIDIAMSASRTLVVIGISTAVLEVTEYDPFDIMTLEYYTRLSKKFVFLSDELYSSAKPYLGENIAVRIENRLDKDKIIAIVKEIFLQK
jgi:transketolase C-terminal domain/subunit